HRDAILDPSKGGIRLLKLAVTQCGIRGYQVVPRHLGIKNKAGKLLFHVADRRSRGLGVLDGGRRLCVLRVRHFTGSFAGRRGHSALALLVVDPPKNAYLPKLGEDGNPVHRLTVGGARRRVLYAVEYKECVMNVAKRGRSIPVGKSSTCLFRITEGD